MKISLKDIQFKIECHPEDVEIRGNALASGDDSVDREVEDKIRNELEAGNQWAWCCIQVTAFIPGIEMEASDYLGCCSYESEKAFKECLYYFDMQQEAKAALLHQIEKVKALEFKEVS